MASVAAAASERGGVRAGFALVAASGLAAALLVFFLPRIARFGWVARFKVGRWLQEHCACRRTASQAWLLISVSWALRALAVFVLLQALSVGSSFPLALAFLCASAASAALPIAPAGAATQAGAGAAILIVSGIPKADAFAFSVAAQGMVILAGAAVVAAAGFWHLGLRLSGRGHAVDLDPQGNLPMSQGWNPDEVERALFDVLVHQLPIEEIIRPAEVDVAVSSIDLAGAELALSSMIGRERALERALRPIKERYDYILIDTPPSLGLLTINALVASDGVIVPVQCEYLSLRGLAQLQNTLAMIRENLNPNVDIQGILPTMFDRRLLHAREAVEILKENFGDLVYNTRIRKTVRYAEAPVKGQSVLTYDPTSEAAMLYRDLAKEVLNGAQAREHA